MKFRNIIQEIEKTDHDAYDKVSGRRDVLKDFGAKVAVAALPLAIGSLFQKVQAKSTDAVIDSLNFLLKLKYFEYTFYRTGTNTGGLIPGSAQAGYKTIELQEKAHTLFLITTITDLGGVAFLPNHYTDPTTDPPYVPKAYDFTKGGAYPVFSDYPTFVMMAQVIEDTFIRAFNGQLSNFFGSALLTQVQQIMAADGRHAAHSRFIRRQMGAPEVPAPWITNDIAPKNPDFNANYQGEDNETQKDVVITSLPGIGGNIPQLSATAAFDEPMDKTKVNTLLAPYILP